MKLDFGADANVYDDEAEVKILASKHVKH